MATLEALRIKNLRSLVDTDWIEQRPITILVGKNSAGKSTYARVFPLLRQSATSKRRSPMLWYGQFVDFGQFSTAVHNHEADRKIEFHFRVGLNPEDLLDDRLGYRSNMALRRTRNRKFEVEVAIKLRPGSSTETADTLADSLQIVSQGLSAEFRFDIDGAIQSIAVDGKDIWRQKAGELSRVTYESALPTLSFFQEKTEESDAGDELVYLEGFDPFTPHLYSEVKRHVHGNLGEDRLRQLVSRLSFGNDEYFNQAALNAGSDYRIWLDYIRGGMSVSNGLRSLKRAVFIAKLPDIIETINRHLTRQFSTVKYVEPLRATAQRYYRKQDLAVDELDPKGGNVAQFLQSLPAWRKKSFDDFSTKLFGFVVKPEVRGGHIELLLAQSDGSKLVNLADAGVGFSQMLPILLQIWAATIKEFSQHGRIAVTVDPYLVIEQPELHLHPAYQAALADLLCEVSGQETRGRKARIIAETHSPALVNRLATLVCDGRLRAEDVQILLFEQDDVGKATSIRRATFDSHGNLENWPFGFFEPEF